MVLKIIGATEARVGTNIIIESKPFTIKKIDISKTGKHGHAKARIEANGILSPGKKVFVMPGHDKLEIPMISKNKGQVLSISDNIEFKSSKEYLLFFNFLNIFWMSAKSDLL